MFANLFLRRNQLSLVLAVLEAAANGEKLAAQIGTSNKYKYWKSIPDEKRCLDCKANHGKIWEKDKITKPKPPIHFFDRCRILTLETITAGTATVDGVSGADWYLKYNRKLPENYVSVDAAENEGWKKGKNPSDFVPRKIITGGIYQNRNGHLPQASGRIWYEADINYKKGKRNSQRIVWSNDGLVFVTYDHYLTFYEVV